MTTTRAAKIYILIFTIWMTYIFIVLIDKRHRCEIAIKRQRVFVKNETKNIKFNYTSGRPIRNMLVTNFDNGGEEIIEILNKIPGNYHHFQPLILYGNEKLRDIEIAEKAVVMLKNLFHCDYKNFFAIFNGSKKVKEFILQFYGRQKQNCNLEPTWCWERIYLKSICNIYPIQTMSLYRLKLIDAVGFLNDASLNVRIIFLVRDPRGTMQSRKHREWCADNPDCDNPKIVCEDLAEDYTVAEELLKKYPSRFRILRYEDLSLNPYEMTQDILQFYGLPFDPLVEEFLDSHTKVNIGGVSSTYRDSRSAPFHWKQDLKIEEIKHIQDNCVKAMDLWRYRRIDNFTDFQSTFDPIILPPPLT